MEKVEVICRHREYIEPSTQIGKCRDCGQERQYLPYTTRGPKVIVLSRGQLKGRVTMVKPPPLANSKPMRLHSLKGRCSG